MKRKSQIISHARSSKQPGVCPKPQKRRSRRNKARRKTKFSFSIFLPRNFFSRPRPKLLRHSPPGLLSQKVFPRGRSSVNEFRSASSSLPQPASLVRLSPHLPPAPEAAQFSPTSAQRSVGVLPLPALRDGALATPADRPLPQRIPPAPSAARANRPASAQHELRTTHLRSISKMYL